MNSSLNGTELTISLSGRIDSSNAAEKEREMLEAIASAPECSVIFDAEDLEYISSAGLRSVLKIKKEKKDVRIINVSRDVYDIFEMTGFTEVMDIEKALRQFSVDGLEKVGQGGTAAVYRLDDDKMIKVFKPVYPIDTIKNEKKMAQKLFFAGIPTAVPYDVVKCGESIGVIYEMLNSSSLQDLIVKEPENEEKYVYMMADLLQKTSKIRVEGLKDGVERLLRACAVLPQYGIATEEEKAKYDAILKNIPKSEDFTHGDFHPGNIMMSDGELMLIDLSSAAYGHIIIELSGVCTYFAAMSNILKPEYYMGFSGGIVPDRAKRLWNVFKDHFFAGKSGDFIAKAEVQIMAVSYLRLLAGAAFVPDLITPDCVGMMKDYLDKNYDAAVSEIEF
jgi:uncharacterized protein (TIGR02172 family)